VPCVGSLGGVTGVRHSGEQIIEFSLDALRERDQLASGRRRAQIKSEHRRRAPHRRLVLASKPDRTSEEVRGEANGVRDGVDRELGMAVGCAVSSLIGRHPRAPARPVVLIVHRPELVGSDADG